MLTLLLACTKGHDTGAFHLHDMGYRGGYNVGYSTEVLTYTDPLGAERELDVMHWYPTEQDGGAKAEYLGMKRDDIYQDAEPITGTQTVVFSHGHLGFPEASGFLMVHLASWGFHVVAMEHAGDTTFDGGDRQTEIYYQRPHDVSATLDHLGVERTVAIGHSFGGYTTFALAGARFDPQVVACPDGSERSNFCDTMTPEKQALFEAGFRDERIVASVPMAAGDYDLFGPGVGDVAIPTLMMTGTCDHPPGSFADDLWANLDGDKTGLVLADGGHNAFTNFAGTIDTCDRPLLDAEEGWTIIQGWTTAFAWRHLNGDTIAAPILENEVIWSDAASMR